MVTLVPDEELMLQVREGAEETLAVLFDRYHVPLFNFYAKLTGDRGSSEDLVQEVFLRILKYRRSYRPGTPFRPWMYQIARNARLDHVRKHPADSEYSEAMAPVISFPDSAQQTQESALLHRALMELPEEKREVLILSRFQELKYEEIARLLGCEVGAVKVRVHRALQDLRVLFQGLAGGPRGEQKISKGPKASFAGGTGNEL
jgi:RNA polymerase sigma-70 factor, ECF subfamily